MPAAEPLTVQPSTDETDAAATGGDRANLGRRFGAALFDLVLVAGPITLIALTQARTLTGAELYRVGLSTTGSSRGWTDQDLAVTAACGLMWAVIVLAFVPANAGGSTPGLRLAGLRVVTTSGAPAGLRQHLIRTAVGVIDLLPLIAPGMLGAMVVLGHSEWRRLGDLAAGTKIVEVSQRRQRLAAEPLAADAHEHPGATPIDLTGEAALPPVAAPTAPGHTSDMSGSAEGANPEAAPSPSSDAGTEASGTGASGPGPQQATAVPEWHETLGAWVYRDVATNGLFRHDVEQDRWLPVKAEPVVNTSTAGLHEPGPNPSATPGEAAGQTRWFSSIGTPSGL